VGNSSIIQSEILQRLNARLSQLGILGERGYSIHSSKGKFFWPICKCESGVGSQRSMYCHMEAYFSLPFILCACPSVFRTWEMRAQVLSGKGEITYLPYHWYSKRL